METVVENNYLVCVKCFTFNHAIYIEDALKGFTMQQTSFPFVCAIVDDASTDGEQNVIRNYLQEHFDLENKDFVRNEETEDYVMTFARHKENKNCYFVIYYLKYNHRSIKKSKMPYIKKLQGQVRYVAICEGDDYWIDPLKLEKQVKIMENNKGLYLCGSNGLVLWERATHHPVYFSNQFDSKRLNVVDVIGHWAFPTASLIVRSDIYKDYPQWTKKIYSGDMTLILLCALKGDGVYSLGDVTSVYRRDEMASSSLSITTSKIKTWKHRIMLYKEFNKYSNWKYDEVIMVYQKRLEKLVKFHELKEKSIIYPLIYMPLYSFGKIAKRIKVHIFNKFMGLFKNELSFFVES